MDRRCRLAAIASSTFLALGLLSSIAAAAPKDAAAQKLDKEAMYKEFAENVDMPAAEKKLKKAVDTCGATGCTPKIKAQILVHLGILQIDQGKNTEGEASFTEALKLDSSVSPEKDYSTPDIEKIFAAAQQKATGGAAATPPTGEGPEPGGEQGSELTHTPVVEQMINTPVPIFVATPEGMPIGKVIVMYKPFGSTWKKLELRKMRGGWGGLIPCQEITTTGDLKYYINVLDTTDTPIAGLHSINQPYLCKIKNQLDGNPPSLPHTPPPAQCAAKEDCPPGLPGCPNAKKGGEKGWGASCDSSTECQSGLMCKGGVCEEDTSAKTGDDEGPTPHRKVPRWMAGFFVSPDLALVSGNDVCGRSSQANDGYACFRKNPPEGEGKQYHGDPDTHNNINTGVALATIRVMVSLDRLITDNITVGGRLGYAFNGGPKPDSGNAFLPYHLELRGTYWLGDRPFERDGLRPFVFVSGGMAQVDTKVDVAVREKTYEAANPDPNTYPDGAGDPYYNPAPFSSGYCHGQNPDPNSAYPCPVNDSNGNLVQSNPRSQKVEAWRKSGQGFAAIGIGAMYPVGPRNGGVIFDLKIAQMFPTSGTVFSPEIGYALGF